MCDWLSRQDFDKLTGYEFEELAQEAFARMDKQLDLGLQAVKLLVECGLKFSGEIYAQSEFKEIWDSLAVHEMKFHEEKMF